MAVRNVNPRKRVSGDHLAHDDVTGDCLQSELVRKGPPRIRGGGLGKQRGWRDSMKRVEGSLIGRPGKYECREMMNVSKPDLIPLKHILPS